MANKKGVKIVTILVIAVFIIFMGLSAVMYFVGGAKPTTTEAQNGTTGMENIEDVTANVQVNTGE